MGGVNITEIYPGAGTGVATLEVQMTSLQKMVDDLRAGDGTLEELMTPLQKIVDEIHAGDGTLEALFKARYPQ